MKAEPTFTNRVVGRDFFSCERYYRIGFNTDFCKRYPSYSDDYDLLSPILPNSLRTIPLLTCLTIAAEYAATLDSSLTSALLHLMHLPTIYYIEISSIRNVPLSGLTSSDNLHRLNISHLFDAGREDGSLEIVQLRRFFANSVTMKLLHANLQDDRPAFNFMDLRRLSISSIRSEDEQKWDFPQCTHVEGTWFDGLISFFGVFKGLRGIGSDGGT